MNYLRDWYQTECDSGNWLELVIVFVIKIMKIKLWN